MTRTARRFPAWLLPLIVAALAIAFVAFDPFALGTQFAQLEFDYLRRVALPGGAERSVNSVAAQIVFLEIFGALLAILFARRRPFWAIVVGILGAAAAKGATWFLYAQHGILFASATAGAGILVAAATGGIAAFLQRRRPRSRIPVPQAAHEEALRPAVESRLVASLSCCLRRAPEIAGGFAGNAAGFTRFAEEALAPLLQEAVRRGAIIGNYDGTSFSAHWEEGRRGADYADEACDAAGRMIADAAKFNERLTREQSGSGATVIEIGIGLAVGPALVGGVRVQGHTATCVAGPGAEMADHLRRLSVRYGPAILASGNIRDATQRGHAFLEVDFVALEPGAEPVTLYALLGNPLLAASPKFHAVATFHEHIFEAVRDRDWGKARALIAQCRKLSGVSDKVYELQLARISWFEANPAPENWDGAFRAVVR